MQCTLACTGALFPAEVCLGALLACTGALPALPGSRSALKAVCAASTSTPFPSLRAHNQKGCAVDQG
eukprot:1141225-Pelagomonas_calceolata.AAC.3